MRTQVDRSMPGHAKGLERGMAAAQELLNIDPVRAAAAIAAYLEALVIRQRTEGVLLGLSGGVDSAVCHLACRTRPALSRGCQGAR